MRTPLVALCAALALSPASLSAQDKAAAPQKGAVAEAMQVQAPAEQLIPFDPPLDTPLGYRQVRTRTQDGQSEGATIEQALTYHREGDLLLLTVTTLTAGDGTNQLTPAQIRRQGGATVAALFAPVTMELDQGGLLVRVRDWERHRESLRASVDLLVADEPPARRAAARAVAEQAMAPMLAMSAEQAPEMLLTGWPAALGLGGYAYSEGVPREFTVYLPMPQSPLPIPFAGAITVDRNFGGQIVFHRTQQPDPVSMRQAIGSYLESVLSPDDPDFATRSAELAAEMRAMTVRDEIEVVLDPVNGMVDSARIERQITDLSTGLVMGGEVITIDRND